MVIALLMAWGLFAPFATFRANRIVAGEAVGGWAALPPWAAIVLFGVIVFAAGIALLPTRAPLRLAAGLSALTALLFLVGLAGSHLTPTGDTFARVSPAYGFWILVFAFALLATEALTRLEPAPFAASLPSCSARSPSAHCSCPARGTICRS